MRFNMMVPALLGLAAFSAPAFAQDEPAAGDRDPGKGYSGIYVGGSFGVPAQPNDTNSRILFDTDRNGRFGDTVRTGAGADAFSPGFCNGRATSTAPTNCTNDRDGLEYFGRVGADHQFGRFVVGALGEFGKSQARDSVSAFSTTPASYTFTREAKYNAGFRGRLGYTPNDTTLFYGTGGVAYARLKNSFSTSNTANAFTTTGNSDAWGYGVGGGVEQRIGRFSIGVEYLHTSLNDKDYRVTAGPGSAPATNPFLLVNATGTDMRRSDTRFNTNSIRAVAAFRF